MENTPKKILPEFPASGENFLDGKIPDFRISARKKSGGKLETLNNFCAYWILSRRGGGGGRAGAELKWVNIIITWAEEY